MLNKLKSLFILKKVFSLLNERKKLAICQKNKEVQKKMNIQLNFYKIVYGKYTIYEHQNQVKEYNISNDKLLFEGIYSKRKRNGYGKEFDSCGQVIFEGEFLNGKRNGNGREYFDNGEISFEGEYLNGKKWNGKGYDTNNNIKYELKNGNGKIIFFHDNGEILFDGEYVNGEINGKGKEYNKTNDLSFEGEYYHGKKWNGYGYDENHKIIYELKSGKGKIKEYKYGKMIY